MKKVSEKKSTENAFKLCFTTHQSLYYFFLISDLFGYKCGDTQNLWDFICERFGTNEKDRPKFSKILTDSNLQAYNTLESVVSYSYYLVLETEEEIFGKDPYEKMALEIKKNALKFIESAFPNDIKFQRLQALSLVYNNDKTLMVLYALVLLFSDKRKFEKKAVQILKSGFEKMSICEAGIILLYLNDEKIDKLSIISRLSTLPDMLFESELMANICEKYGYNGEIENIENSDIIKIGFGGA